VSLSLSLLGPFLVALQPGRPVELTSKKAQALLAYLAVESDRPHYREALAGLLWPDSSEQAARGSLRQALQDLRRALGDSLPAAAGDALLGEGGSPVAPLLLISRDTVQFNRQAPYWLDVAQFAKHTASLSRQPSSMISPAQGEALRAAVALYRGPFLDGFSLGGANQGDSPAFEEWVLLNREQLNRQMLLALSALATFHEAREAYEEALDCVWRLLALEPWQEEAHQHAMRLLALMGRRGEALAQYRHCRALLLRELGVEPAPDTIALYETIRHSVAPERPSGPSGSARRGDGAPPPVAAAGAPPSLLVARDEELSRLLGFMSQALAGDGRIALVSGEAGSGKTSLLEEFARQAMNAREDLLVALGRCSGYGAGDAFRPFREVLQTLTGNTDGVLSARHAQRLQAALPVTFEALAQQGPDLARLLARDAAFLARARAAAPRGAAWLARLQSLAQRGDGAATADLAQATFSEQGVLVLQEVARWRPVLLLLDDLQWADAPSLDMLFHLGRRLQGRRVLIIGAYRPTEAVQGPVAEGQSQAAPLEQIANEFQRLWGDIRVDLSQADARRFVDAYLDSWPNRLGKPFRQTLARHTGGNPLFTVELVRAMQERGDLLRDGQGRWVEGPSLAWEKLPPRVEGAISQRIGQLTAAQREMLEAAAVEGEQFHAEVLARVLDLPLPSVIAALSGPLGRAARLVVPRGLVNVGARDLSRYRFRHGMFQSYLYERLDAAPRAQLHGAVAAAIEALYAEQARKLAGALAQHHEAAGQAALAARRRLEAGQQAAWLGAHRQAIAAYQQALSLLEDLPAGSERVNLELQLQMALDYSLQCTEGWGSDERLRVSNRAYELGRQLGWPTPDALPALGRKCDLHMARGEYDQAVEVGGELLGAAQRLGDPAHVALATLVLGNCHVMRGELSQAWLYLSRLEGAPLPLREPQSRRIVSLLLQAHIAAGVALLAMGYPDQARQKMDRAVAASDDPMPPQDSAYIRNLAGMFFAAAHQDILARQHAEQVLRIAEGRDLPEMQAWGAVLLGWAEARAGQRQGIARMAAALPAQRERGTELGRYFLEVLLAEAHLAGGQAKPAMAIIDQALARTQSSGTRYCEAMLCWLRGEALLQGAVVDHVAAASNDASQGANPLPPLACYRPETCFQRAIEVARRQGARLWELRATTSLAWVWTQEGRWQEAREALAAIYATFTEGFDLPDLIEAKALLDDLNARHP